MLDKKIVVAKIGKTHGVKGALKLYSFTERPNDILTYKHFFIRLPHRAWEPMPAHTIQAFAQDFLIQFNHIQDCNTAQQWVNAELAVSRADLPVISNAGQYYWTDLEGCEVVNTGDVSLGHVDHLFETGANDVMVIKGERERLLPFIKQVVQTVSLPQKKIIVEWDPEW